MAGEYYVYIILSHSRNCSYCGYTVDPVKRLRQHNGHISGGAKATKGKGPWEYLAVITCTAWKSKSPAMSLEWHIKHNSKSGFYGPQGRLRALSLALHDYQNSKDNGHMQLYIANDVMTVPRFLDSIEIVKEPFW